MFKYTVKRLLVAIPTFFGITVLVYLISAMAPGSPLEMLMADPMATKESMEALKTQMGLNDPAIIQYFRWLAAMLQGNLGISYRNSLPVLGQVLEKLGPTLILTLSSTVLSVLIAVPLGIMSAYKPYSAWDYASSGFAFVGASTPTFFTGLVMIYIFAVKLRVLPMGGMYDAGVHTVASAVNHLILPCLVLTIFNIGSILRQTRGSMMEVFSEDYIRTARAKGLIEPRVVIVHGLQERTDSGGYRAQHHDTVHVRRSGRGRAGIQLAGTWKPDGPVHQCKRLPMIMGITVVIAAAVLIGNVLTDIAYSLLDPKIRESR